MRRVTYAAGFVVILLLVGAFLFPRMRGNAAIADAMQAMASVKTCHFTGSMLSENGNRMEIEGWFRAPDRLHVHNGDSHESYLLDGKEIIIERDKVTISRNDTDVQSIFVGGLFRRAMSLYQYFDKVDVKQDVLPNGHEALVIAAHEKQRYYEGTAVFTIDRATDLMVSMREYNKQGQLTNEIDNFEYDVPIPDSAFKVEIPDSLPVTDNTK